VKLAIDRKRKKGSNDDWTLPHDPRREDHHDREIRRAHRRARNGLHHGLLADGIVRVALATVEPLQRLSKGIIGREPAHQGGQPLRLHNGSLQPEQGPPSDLILPLRARHPPI
jgi:hypothetical protein